MSGGRTAERGGEDRFALEPLFHGGNLAEAARLFPQAPQPWIDLSTGINPNAYPIPAVPLEAYHRLPAPSALTDLESVARLAYGAPPASSVLAAAGTHPILTSLSRLLPHARVAILGPTYAEHAHVWRRAGNAVEVVQDLGALLKSDVAVIVRPNNPDGRFEPRRELDDLLGQSRRTGQLLIIDEAFVDLFPPGSSLVDGVPEANLLVLRSFGKTYGLAGLRLAFAIGRADNIAPLRAELGPWPVSGPAIAIAARALDDASWLARARAEAEAASHWLIDLMMRNGLPTTASAPLFHCIDHDAAATLFHHLGRCGIYVRRFADQPRRLRIGLPPEDPEIRRRIAHAFDTFKR